MLQHADTVLLVDPVGVRPAGDRYLPRQNLLQKTSAIPAINPRKTDTGCGGRQALQQLLGLKQALAGKSCGKRREGFIDPVVTTLLINTGTGPKNKPFQPPPPQAIKQMPKAFHNILPKASVFMAGRVP